MSRLKTDFEIAALFQAAVDEALEAGWSEQRIREEFEHAFESAWEPE
jgi:hypothetical protein